ncbi:MULTISPECIES: DUF448 domain-containing protein [Pacificimonas]|nr:MULTISPECIES: DUF448 domain-containing protein [Pacificimonas]MBZ6378232.1 DUF448 domain-containing protein [Pacificimonas aurantium]
MRTATNDPQRTCILSGRQAGPDQLIRLALSPDGHVLPDPAAKAPGRGAWIGVSAEDVRSAQGSGKLRGALGRAFKGDARSVPDDLAAAIEEELARRAFDRIGLETRAGHLSFGFERVLSAARSGDARLLLHAADAADDGVRKLDSALQSGRPGAKSIRLPAGRERLSMAVGQANVVHAASTNAGAATRIEAATDRWRAFCGLEERNGGRPAPAM